MSLLHNALGLINRTHELNRRPFDANTTIATQHGRFGIIHYGVMIPGLPEPFCFFDAIVVLGTSKAPIFDNRKLATTDDPAWVLVGSAITRDSFREFSQAADCDLAPDGKALRFGDDLDIKHGADEIALKAVRPQAHIELTIRPTAAVSHFAHMLGVYDHWSVLCEYEGTFTPTGGETFTQTGLCTFEYARAVNLPLPFRFFTYQILNIDDNTQVLFTDVRATAGLPVSRYVYVRRTDGTATVHSSGFHHEVLATTTVTTPDGAKMELPTRFRWSCGDLVTIEGETNGDWAYGLAAGYAGSYRYTGTFEGESIDGTGYIEWIER
ncbi:DUF6670 family protein [Smaragdicoccus niigatensis]|uniref:DUF6670 family protein n=1 Tax=Smaragdicoccus niigatensis TaxID=359359 RepID=UPI00037A6E4A|nr:DUF6670 family protein [Smaragdicoccus niigatensis]